MSASRDTYTHGHHDSVLRSHSWRTVANSAAYLKAHLVGGLRLLDVGCGPATLTADLAHHVAPGEVVAIEPDPAIVAVAADALRAAGADNAKAEQGDVYALSYADASFDIVHAHQVLQHLSEPVAALREMRRVCRPGGVVAVRDADYGAIRFWPELPELVRWLALYQEVARSNHAFPDAGRRLLAWAHEAGFVAPVPLASVWCFATPEDRSWWAGTWAERIVSSAIATQACERGLSTNAELEWIAAGWRRWMEEPDAWFSLTHAELLARVD
ncbi:MAG: class I SAM-dependent methyltransferase [Gammaproteobacteria bacterium]